MNKDTKTYTIKKVQTLTPWQLASCKKRREIYKKKKKRKENPGGWRKGDPTQTGL